MWVGFGAPQVGIWGAGLAFRLITDRASTADVVVYGTGAALGVLAVLYGLHKARVDSSGRH